MKVGCLPVCFFGKILQEEFRLGIDSIRNARDRA